MSQKDGPTDPHPTLDQTLDKAKTISGQARKGLERAREPDMPLGIISSLTKESPLPALMIAFLLGILIGRHQQTRLPPTLH
jgi:hypothetical protein